MYFINILLAALLLPVLPASAHVPKEGKITALAGPFIYKTNFGADVPSLEAPILGGAGLIVEGDIDNNGGLEIAMFYLHKEFFRQMAGRYLAEKVKLIYITMGYRHWFSEEFSAAGSFYSSYTMGDPQVIHTDFAPNEFVDTSARDATEYGFELSLQWEFWHNDKVALAFDGRYSLSVTGKDHEDGDHYGLFFGAKFLVQEKKERVPPPQETSDRSLPE